MEEGYDRVPEFAASYPAVVSAVEHVHLPFYCCNCTRKAETRYVTPSFGPFCRECWAELQTALVSCEECGKPSLTRIHESCAGFRQHIEQGGTLD